MTLATIKILTRPKEHAKEPTRYLMQQYRVARLDFRQIDDRLLDRQGILLRYDQTAQLRYRSPPLLDQLIQAAPPRVLARPPERGRQRVGSRDLRVDGRRDARLVLRESRRAREASRARQRRRARRLGRRVLVADIRIRDADALVRASTALCGREDFRRNDRQRFRDARRRRTR